MNLYMSLSSFWIYYIEVDNILIDLIQKRSSNLPKLAITIFYFTVTSKD